MAENSREIFPSIHDEKLIQVETVDNGYFMNLVPLREQLHHSKL